MNVDFTPDQAALVQQAIATGRLRHENEAVKQALMLWEERERRRLEILAAVELSKTQLARGEGRTVTTSEESDRFVRDVTVAAGPVSQLRKVRTVEPLTPFFRCGSATR